MKKHYIGLDVLRGLGIFAVIILHTSFYFFADIYDIDLDNPSLLVTLIGFMLMFAGLFAMISGLVHTLQFNRKTSQLSKKALFKYMSVSALVLLVVAYAYFLFTGPGIIDFENRRMDESLLVALINGNALQISLERLVYVDSLVMLAMNLFLLGVVLTVFDRFRKHRDAHLFALGAATVFMVASFVRIPLYPIYLEAFEEGKTGVMLLLNWFVAKNNPILPFFGFALMGCYVALLLERFNHRSVVRRIIPVAVLYLVVGVLGYIFSPETMLERDIDPTWYFIMVIQIGIFLFMVLGFISWFDIKKQGKTTVFSRFLSRFGVAGLTVFFIESVVSALVFQGINVFTTLRLGMFGAIVYGFILALLWGGALILWEKKQYRYGIEWSMTQIIKRFGPSTKADKLEGDTHGTSKDTH